MSYALKYELLCRSRLGNNYKLKLLFDGYIGDDIDRNMPADRPLLLKKDRAAVIRGTSLEFAIREEVDFEFDEFYTNNPKKIKAELYKDTTLLWTGYVLPQQYQAPYIPVPLSVRFTATDGLGLLKEEPFTLTGFKSQLEIIAYCIDKIGLSLGYSIAINLFASLHSTDRSPLAQTYEYAEIYSDMKCYQVLEKMLERYDAEITQFNGKWHITCSADKKSTRMLYTSAGVYEGTEAAQAVLNLGYAGLGTAVWPVGQLNRTLEAGAKKVSIQHNFGKQASLLENSDFSLFSGGMFSGWTKTGTFNLYQKYIDGIPYAYIEGSTGAPEDSIGQTIEITGDSNQPLMLDISWCPIGRTIIDERYAAIPMIVQIGVILQLGSTNYFLNNDWKWTTEPSYIREDFLSSLFQPDAWNVLKVLTPGFSGSGLLQVNIYRHYILDPVEGHAYAGIAVLKVDVNLLDIANGYPSGVRTQAVFNNSTESNDLGTIKLIAAESPDVLNAKLLYKNILFYSDGTPITRS